VREISEDSQMTRLKGAAILLGLLVAGTTLLSSLPASGGLPDLSSDVARRLATACPPSADRALCRFVAGIIQFVAEPEPVFVRKALPRLRPVVRLPRGERDCDGCLQAVGDIEALLATNGTAAGLENMVFDGCARFRTQAQVQECQELSSFVPQAIDKVLANMPPQIACSSGDRRPFIYCRGDE
jgi:hypothetical protein